MKIKPFASFICILTLLSLTGCSHYQYANNTNASLTASGSHPLKTKNDLKIEALLTTGVWKYQRQDSDCDDTKWIQRFHKNHYYQSSGSACLLTNAFSMTAENWHVKNKMLYVTNLSPIDGEDIILKYRVDSISRNTLIISSNSYKYTFKK